MGRRRDVMDDREVIIRKQFGGHVDARRRRRKRSGASTERPPTVSHRRRKGESTTMEIVNMLKRELKI
jgi:hypothetical protein